MCKDTPNRPCFLYIDVKNREKVTSAPAHTPKKTLLPQRNVRTKTEEGVRNGIRTPSKRTEKAFSYFTLPGYTFKASSRHFIAACKSLTFKQ